MIDEDTKNILEMKVAIEAIGAFTKFLENINTIDLKDESQEDIHFYNDPDGEFDMYYASIGFFNARGLSLYESSLLASWARYNMEYWGLY